MEVTPTKADRPGPGSDPELLYLDLLKNALTRYIFEDYEQPRRGGLRKRWVRRLVTGVAALGGFEVVRKAAFDPGKRANGSDWPGSAETMVGIYRLENLQHCLTQVIRDGIPGDFLEAGVWRGGASIFAKGVLSAYRDSERHVWVCDSFRGLPRPDAENYPADAGSRLWRQSRLAISVDQVRGNFERYGLLDDRVHFVEGWFKDTLGSVPVEKLSVLRLDGDLYESTMDVLRPLYPKLSPGGFVIVDDYRAVDACKEAITDYRAEHGITEPIVDIDWTGAYWRKGR